MPGADRRGAFVRMLAWDSSHFGFPVASIETHSPSNDELRQAVAEADLLGARCVYFLCDSGSPEAAAAASRLGFELVDLRVTLARTIRPEGERSPLAPEPILTVRRATVADLDSLSPLARSSFLESRFFVDTRFPRRAVEQLFAIWVDREVSDARGLAFVVEREREIAGFASGVREENEGRIGLVAVAESVRGLGVGRLAVRTLVDGFSAAGADRVSVVTQGRNVGAIRLYEQSGFRTSSIRIWYHRWT